MPNRNLLFVALATAVLLTACHKSSSNSGQAKIQVLSLEDSCVFEMGTSAVHPMPRWGKPGNAVLQVNKLTGMLRDSNGVVTPVYRLSAEALFCDGSSVYNVSAGNLSLNGAPVTFNPGSFQRYISYNNAVPWNDTGTNQWQVGGSANFPAATVSMDGSFPEFTGVLPDSVSPSNFTFTFNSSNTFNADSAVLFLYAGFIQSSNAIPIDAFSHGQIVDASSGTAGISPYAGGQYTNYHLRVQNKSYNTALLVVALLKETQQMVNGKMFTLARQRIIYKNVVIK